MSSIQGLAWNDENLVGFSLHAVNLPGYIRKVIEMTLDVKESRSIEEVEASFRASLGRCLTR